MRLAAGTQVLAIIIGWFHSQAPALLRTEEGNLTLQAAAAPLVTQAWLAGVLLAVLAFTIPVLIWLYAVFASKSKRAKPRRTKQLGPTC